MICCNWVKIGPQWPVYLMFYKSRTVRHVTVTAHVASSPLPIRHRRGGDVGRLPPALALLPSGCAGEFQHGQQHHPVLRHQRRLAPVPAGERQQQNNQPRRWLEAIFRRRSGCNLMAVAQNCINNLMQGKGLWETVTGRMSAATLIYRSI